MIDLFVKTYRLSSHARLEAFVIQTKQNKNGLVRIYRNTYTHCSNFSREPARYITMVCMYVYTEIHLHIAVTLAGSLPGT